jgi:signal transduction histidine kinase
MSGEELLKKFKVLSPDTVRIVVTAYSDLEPILRAVNEGLVVRYIIKPWDRIELEEILKWALQLYELGRTNGAVQLRLVQTERLLTLGQVAAAILHELRQPISVFSMNAALLREHGETAVVLHQLASRGGAFDELSTKHSEALTRLANELPDIAEELAMGSKHLTDVLDQLKEFQQSRASSGKPNDVDPVPSIRLAVSMCRGEASLARCRLVDDVPPMLPHVRATPAQLLQILINVVRNAVEAVAREGPGGAVVVQAVDQETSVRLVVRDDGPGMASEVLAKVGTPFFTTRTDGTGLGIAQVRRLVGVLGGTFELESAEGKGTTVTVTLPKHDPSA